MMVKIMKDISFDKCPYCGSNSIGIGYHLGNGNLFADQYGYYSQSSSSRIVVYLCKDCGMIIAQKIMRPEIFENASRVKDEELLDIINDYGFLLVNKHDYLPSLDELGFTMQNVIHLIEKNLVFYTKAFRKRPIYLSINAYQLLKRVKTKKPLSSVAQNILKEMNKYQLTDKEEIKRKLNLDSKTFNKAFDELLEQMLVTACGGRKNGVNWYNYLYCTSEQFNRFIDGLHFNGDAQDKLWEIVGKKMNIKDFKLLCK